MELFENFTKEHVCMDMGAVDRDDALHEILDLFVKSGRIKEEGVEPILLELVRRETLGTTAIGRSMALPHARLEAVGELSIALGLSKEGIAFHALDGLPVNAIFLVIGPKSDSEGYIQAMKTVSNMSQSEDFRRFLFKARSGAEVADLVREMGGKMG